MKISRAVGDSKAIIAIRHKSPDASIIVNTTCEADDDIHGVDDEIQQDLKEWMRSRRMVLKLRMAMVALPKITAGTSA